MESEDSNAGNQIESGEIVETQESPQNLEKICEVSVKVCETADVIDAELEPEVFFFY